MKRKTLLLLLLLALVAPWAAMGQETRTIVEIGTGTSTNYYPMPGFYGYQYDVYLYTPTAAAELGVDSDISSIAYDLSSISSTTGATMEIWIKDVDASYTLAASTTFASYTSGATKVVNGAFTTDATGWKTMAFSSTFNHEGGKALLVAVRGVGCTTSGGCSRNCRYTTASNTHWYKRADSTDPGTSATGSVDSNRSNIRLDVTYTGSVCFAPTGLECTAYTTTTATLAWTPGSDETAWVLQYSTNSSFSGATSVSVSGNPTKELTSLTAEQTYYARVKPDCDTDGTKWSDVCVFKPSAAQIVTIGDGTSTTYNTPYNSLYNYSFVEEIYTADEIGQSGTINSISFNLRETDQSQTNDIVVYMKNVSRSTFSSNTDYETVTQNDIVFSGSYTFAPGWTTITLTTPFEYDGTSNLMIAIDENSSGYSTRYFYYTSKSNSVLGYYSDSYNPDPYNLDSYSGSHVLSANRANIQLNITPPAQGDCVRPTLAAVDPQTIEEDQATISWTENGTATNWVLEYATSSNFANATSVNVNSNPYQLTGLTADQTYYVRVKADCGGDSESSWSNVINFRTACGAITIGDTPWTENFEDFYHVTLATGWNDSKAYMMDDGCWDVDHGSNVNPALYTNYKPAAFSGNTSVQFTNAKGSATLIFPEFTNALNTLQFEFKACVYLPSYEGTMEVGYWYNGEFTAIHTGIQTQTARGANDNTNASGDYMGPYYFNGNIPSGSRMAIHYNVSTSSGCINLDDFRVSLKPSCVPPSNVAVTENSVTAHNATITWTENGDATNWSVEYATNADFTSATTENVNGNPTYTFQGLAAETSYYVRVYALCGVDDDSQPSNTINFTTAIACPVPTNLTVSNITGYTATLSWVGESDSYNVLLGVAGDDTIFVAEDFSSSIPAGWTNDATYPWTIVDGHMQSGNAGVASSTSSISVTVTYPADDVIEFDALCMGEGSSTIYDKCIFSIDGTAQFTYGADVSGWNTYSYPVTAGQHIFTWSYTKDSSVNPTGDYFAVDNVNMYWLGIDWYDPVSVTTTEYAFTGLTPLTKYYARVQGDCVDDGMSAESGIISFTTMETCPVPYNLSIPVSDITASSATLNWVGESDSYNVSLGVDGEVTTLVNEDFSGTSIPTGWTNDATYPWTIVDGHMQSGNAGVASSTSEISIMKTFDTDGYIEFDAQCMGEGTSYDVCSFKIDNDVKFTKGANGEQWDHYNYAVTAGQHTFKWSYTKDSSVNPTGDYFAVDNVQMYCQGIDWNDPVSVTTTEYTFTDLTSLTKYYVRVQGVCDDEPTEWSEIRSFTTGSGYQVSVSVNNSTMGSASITYNGETVDSPASIAPDTEVTVTAVPSDGFAFVNWTELNSETGAYDVVVSDEAEYTFTPMGNRDLRANFEKVKYTLTIIAAHGTVTVNNETYIEPIELVEGASVVVMHTADQGYYFDGWTVEGTGSSVESNFYITNFIMGTEDAILRVRYRDTEIVLDLEEGGYEMVDRWYLITSPLAASVAPGDIEGLFGAGNNDPESDEYDLFYFDQTGADNGKEWVNYKDMDHGGGFSLEAGKGYLYATMFGTVLIFSGDQYDGNGIIEITNSSNSSNNKWVGWNLVGNPYTEEAWSNKDYYVMSNSEDGPELVSRESSESLQPMEGFFVFCEDETGIVSLSTTGPSTKHASLALNVTRGRGLVDRAIVSFDNSNTLPKFQLNPSHTKVYVPRDDKDYAVVNAESEMGEVPVNFNAEKSGIYTLSVNADGVSFGYLHLVDNKTGVDIDLLANPSYTFKASSTDYASRFKLVFATGKANEDSFAFYSNDVFVINNDGEATLQVIDVNGRVLSSEQVNGCVSKQINAVPGIYMLRLINGDNVKVQKVVVR